MSDVKTCSRCREAKPLDGFSYRADRPDKRQARCKPCAAAVVAEWRRQNPEQAREQSRRRRDRVQASTPEPFTRSDVLASWAENDIDPDTCFYCGAPDGSTIDHFMPISTDLGYNMPANLRPCCKFCQVSKGASNPYEWIERTGNWPAKWGGPLTGTDLRLAQVASAMFNDAKADQGRQLSADEVTRLLGSIVMAPEVSYVQPAEKPAEETS
ncbi:hypothetical protein ACH4OV_20010 [Streptomyces diastaticus]|uniref:hypothetical protein n=1 Tax=Streptomyces diastaticus TaxID=1956 RepID=UPI0037BAC0E7